MSSEKGIFGQFLPAVWHVDAILSHPLQLHREPITIPPPERRKSLQVIFSDNFNCIQNNEYVTTQRHINLFLMFCMHALTNASRTYPVQNFQ